MLLAARRFGCSPRDAAALVGVRVSHVTYTRMCEYASMLDVHELMSSTAPTPQQRLASWSRALRSHPTMFWIYQDAAAGIAFEAGRHA